MDDSNHLTLRERAHEGIVRMIMSGELRMGKPIDQAVIVEKLNISRTPIREAIGTLEKQGLIEVRPYRGIFVRRLSSDEINDIYELRKLLECFSIRIAAMRMSAAELDECEVIFDRSIQALQAADMVEFGAQDRAFHKLIASSTGNHAVVDALSKLALQIQMCRAVANQCEGFVANSAEERRAMLAALRNRDPELAASLMYVHITNAQQAAIEALGSSDDLTGERLAKRKRNLAKA